MEMMNDQQRGILEFRRGIYRVSPPQSVTAWSESNIRFTQRQTESPGPFSTSVRPYVREPLECWKDPGVSECVLCWGSQTAKTTTLMVGLSWLIDNDPSPVLWLMPTELLARSFSKARWMPMLEDSPVMVGHFPGDRHKMTHLEQHFDRCTLTFVGTNSPANLASRPVRVLVADEVDKFAEATAKEADALDLAEQRMKSFSSSKAFLTSTPTVTEGRIWQRFLRGDQRRFFIPCAACGGLIKLGWSQVKWDQAARKDNAWDFQAVRASAYYECQVCKGKINDAMKVSALRRGEWRAENRNAMPGVRSYHLSSLYSPDRKCTFGNLAVAFLEARDSLLGLQGFINGMLAEPWENQDSRSERIEVISPPDAPPIAEAVKLMTVDVQQVAPHFWFIVRGWNGDSRLVDFGALDNWEEVRAKQQEHGVEDNHVGIDSGWSASDVYERCLMHGRHIPTGSGVQFFRGWTPMKGFERRGQWTDPKTKLPRPFFLGSAALPHRRFRLPLIEWSEDHVQDILERLRKGKARFRWELNDKAGDEYFRHLDSKVKKPVYSPRTGRVSYEYQKRSKKWPDHGRDCETMSIVMAMIHRLLPWGSEVSKEDAKEVKE